jgi:DNA modification methylase
VSVRLIIGDCRAELAKLADQSVNCVVTSPPYFGLRDYGVEGQIGLEKTPDVYVAELVWVFREVRRKLRDDGTLWLNLGDSYAGSWGAQSRGNTTGERSSNRQGGSMLSARQIQAHPKSTGTGSLKNTPGLKPKDLMGVPWRVAFALQADGWYLRQDIIWSKPNPMPESVQDRCTKAHEYVFLLSKSPRYYYDAEAIAEPIAASTVARLAQDVEAQEGSHRVPGKTNGAMKAAPPRFGGNKYGDDDSEQSRTKSGNPYLGPKQAAGKGNAKTFRGGGVYTGGKSFDNSSSAERDSNGNAPNESGVRNARSVWNIATQPFSEAHFATFPPELAERCIKAGCPEGGTVLDPFGGAGTTGLVADRLQRNAILIELNPAYADIARNRIKKDAGLFGEIA